MNITSMTSLTVDEYLDLYLIAQQAGDEKWQKEIIKELQSFDMQLYEMKRDIERLLQEYEEVKVNLSKAAQAYLEESHVEAHMDKIRHFNHRRQEILLELQEKNRALTLYQ